ncbi:MAG: YIP1 family protein [Acidobacteriota bacterium]|nr:YIP1 family protein [Acidobacteriota bacterium]MDE3169278.1 YIP1 family protein [Acidobacteriota bacterium]
MTSTSVSPAPAPESESNSISRVFGVLFNPKATFQSIVRRPTWWLPIVLLVVLAMVVVGIFDKRGGWPAYLQKQMASNSRFQQLSPQQQQRQMAVALKYTPPFVYGEVAIAIPVVIVVIAAILLAMFNLLHGTQIKFKTALSIASYAWVPGIISSLLGIVIISLKDPATVDLQNIVVANASAFIASDAARWKVMLLSSIDIFTFWEMFLLAIGFGVAAPRKLTTGKAFVSIFVVWLIWVVVKVGATAAFS